MTDEQTLKALEGHPNRAEILEVLSEETRVEHFSGNKDGQVIPTGLHEVTEASLDPDGAVYTVHLLDTWRGGWDPEQFKARELRIVSARANVGLSFLDRPNGKGRYKTRGKKTREKIQEAYKRQVAREQGRA